ncbi:hypothetical protein EOM09_03795, partial [bacterium]|nr:hypothetical protein [bacterium]
MINKSGNFSFEISNNIEFSFPLSEHILNSSDNGDFYTLNVECSDIYDQKNLLKVSFMVDMQLGVKIISPLSFIKLEDKIATHKESFFNKDVLFHAVSTENYVDITCSLEFEGETSIPLSIETIDEGFENSKYPELTFYKNISGTISFSNEGKKEGNLNCIDENGNENNIPLVYFFEKTKPSLESFSLNSSGTIKPKNLIDIDGKYYLRNIASIFFDTTLDGTISWINLNDGLKLFVQGEERFELSGAVFMSDKYNESNTKNNINIRNFYDPVLYEGVDSGEANLRLFSYEFEFTDLAENNATHSLTFYYDNSSPKFIFNGDSVIEASNGVLYTRYENPQFDISFNTPSYRTFECNITGKQFGDGYKKSFPFSNNLKFALSEIISNLDLRTFGSANLDFDCTDIYGINLKASYILKFDDINPILNDMFLDRGNKKYYSNAENIHYENLIDKIVFELNDTNEDGYICKYNFNSNSDYACNESIFEIEFSDFGFMKTSDLKILSVDEEDSICKRTASFKSSLDSARSSGNDYNTLIKVDGQCFDYSGLESESKSFNIEINYVDSFIVDFEIKVVDGGYYPFVSTWKDFAGGFKISLDEEGTENNTLGFANIKNEEEDLFVYTSNSPLDVSDLESGEYLVWALAIHNDKIIERINTIMIIDKDAPILSLKIPDIMEGDIIYAEEFLIDMFAKDLENHMKNISLFVDGTFLYEQNRTNLNYDSNLVFVNPADSYCQDDIC